MDTQWPRKWNCYMLVCRKYPSECDKDNEVTKGTKKYQNYMNRHITGLNTKHQKCTEIYLRECFPKHLTCLQEMQINLNFKHEEEVLRLINTSYYINIHWIILLFISILKYAIFKNLTTFNWEFVIVWASIVDYSLILSQLKWNQNFHH